MAAIDATSTVAPEILIARAGRAVARAAVEMMGGTYGRTVAVLAGKGNNGNDGRVAAAQLKSKGCRVRLHELGNSTASFESRFEPVSGCDLVIDAIFGTGFDPTRDHWAPPTIVHDTPVLAVDIPSGISGLTGEGTALRAARTITMVAHKPGLLFSPGRDLAGEVIVADIGLPVDRASAFVVTKNDVARWIPVRQVDAHKWKAAVWVAAGSPGMTGAAHLAARAAQRCGAGMVRLGVPGADPATFPASEIVSRALPETNWAGDVLADLQRFHAVVVGPGLGRSDNAAESIRRVIAACPVPIVVDGDGLVALAWSSQGAAGTLSGRTAGTVVTPHDGEFALLNGARVGPDRVASARHLARKLGCVVLLKGSTTVVADERGRALIVTSGDERLATAGTGDVLSGIIASLVAQGVSVFEAAAAGAYLHGRAASHGVADGLVAGDLPGLIPVALAELHT